MRRKIFKWDLGVKIFTLKLVSIWKALPDKLVATDTITTYK